jgi:hypothetical protein
MISGVRGNWQTIIADLALILFMVTAAAMGSKNPEATDNPLPARGEPLAVYRPHQGTPPFGEWLAAQAADERQQLTIIGRYQGGDVQFAADAALALASDAAEHGVRSRVLLEPAENSDVLAVLAFDSPTDWHADCRAEGTNGAQRASAKDSSCD